MLKKRNVAVSYAGVISKQFEVVLTQELTVQDTFGKKKPVSLEFPKSNLVGYRRRNDWFLDINLF